MVYLMQVSYRLSGYKKLDLNIFIHPVILIYEKTDVRNTEIVPQALSYIRSLLYTVDSGYKNTPGGPILGVLITDGSYSRTSAIRTFQGIGVLITDVS